MRRRPGRKRAWLPLSILGLAFLWVYACVPAPITDLAFVEARRVPASALPVSDDLRDTLMRRGESLWRVSFRGGSGWPREVRRHELNGYAIVARCDRPDATLLALGPYVGPVPISYHGQGLDRFDPGGRRTLRYDVYLPETGRYFSEADTNAPMPSYDLGRERLDLCVRIAGGAMHGAYNRSNEARAHVGLAR